MKNLVALVIATCMSIGVNAQPSLLGQWKSDAKLTMQYNSEHTKLEDKKHKFLSQLMGHLTLTFTEAEVRSEMPTFEVSLASGEKRPFVGSTEAHPYRVLGHSQKSIAVLSRQVIGGPEVITVFNFDSPNVMWVYSGGSDKVFPEEHVREYFVRTHRPNPSIERDVQGLSPSAAPHVKR